MSDTDVETRAGEGACGPVRQGRQGRRSRCQVWVVGSASTSATTLASARTTAHSCCTLAHSRHRLHGVSHELHGFRGGVCVFSRAAPIMSARAGDAMAGADTGHGTLSQAVPRPVRHPVRAQAVQQLVRACRVGTRRVACRSTHGIAQLSQRRDAHNIATHPVVQGTASAAFV